MTFVLPLSMGSHHHHGDSSNLRLAFWLNLTFTVIEGVGGFYVNSVAVLSDALHDLGDSVALGIAWILDRQSRLGPSKRFTFGRQRFSLLGALINSIILIGGSVFVVYEAIPRIMDPEPSNAQGMIVLALLGIGMNGAAVLRLSSSHSLNEKMVRYHLLEDVLGWVAVLLVAIVLLFVPWYFLDPLLSLGITAYIMVGVVRNLRQTLVILLQGSPQSLEVDDICNQLLEHPQVDSLHHTHLWTLDGEHNVFTSHAVLCGVESLEDLVQVKNDIHDRLCQLDLSHFTVDTELEHQPCKLRSEAHHAHAKEEEHAH